MEGVLSLGLEPWTWLILGIVLIGLETFVPGIFLIWLGIAAVLTGLLDYGLDLSWQATLVAFALLSLVSVVAGRALASRRRDGGAELNRRGEAMLGRRFVLDQPIISGEGRVRVDDTVWRVTGPDLPAGAAVRVLRLEGATLQVEPADA